MTDPAECRTIRLTVNLTPRGRCVSALWHTTSYFVGRFQCIFVLNCLLSVGSTQAQVKQLATIASSKDRIGHMWLETYAVGNKKDTFALNKVYDTLLTIADAKQDQLMAWHIDLLKINQLKDLRFTRAVDKIAFLKSKQAYFEQCPYPAVTGAYYFCLSDVYFHNLAFTDAFKLLFRARQIFEKAGYENVPQAVLYLNRFFEIYYYFGDYRTAIHYLTLAEKYNTYKLVDDWFIIDNRGVAYLKIQDYKNAEKDFLKTIAVARAKNHWEYVGIGSGNYGNTLRLQGNYRLALPYLYTDVAINEKTIQSNSAITCLYIAYCLLKLDSTAKAKTYIDKSLQLSPDWIWSSYGRNYYDTKALYFQKVGNLSVALRYKDSLGVFKDSLRQVFDSRLLQGAEAQNAAEKHLYDLQTIETEKNNAVIRRNIVIATIILVALALIYSLNQRRKREKQVQEAENKRATNLLTHATELLAQYIDNLKSKNELIEKMSLELNQRELHPDDTLATESQLDVLRQSVILTESHWQQFKQLFERVYPNFFDNLQTRYQDLTPAEIRLLALLKLNVASREMAYMLGVSVESLRKSRYRLRKKLERFQTDTDLREIIGHI